MKLLALAAFAALTISAQTNQSSTGANSPNIANTKGDVKTEVAKVTQPAPTALPELSFTEVQNLKIRLAQAKIALANKKFDIPAYQKEVKPLSEEQEAIYVEGCKALGIPDNLIRTECGVQPGIDGDGNPLIADGKPVTAKVWWIKAAPPTGTK